MKNSLEVVDESDENFNLSSLKEVGLSGNKGKLINVIFWGGEESIGKKYVLWSQILLL